jgi:hypothetical protein
MSLVQGFDGGLMSVDRARTLELQQLHEQMTERLESLVPDGDEYRWVSQEIDLVEEELEARCREGDPDA